MKNIFSTKSVSKSVKNSAKNAKSKITIQSRVYRYLQNKNVDEKVGDKIERDIQNWRNAQQNKRLIEIDTQINALREERDKIAAA